MSLPHTQPVVPKLAEARRLTRWDHIVNTFRLVIKELRSIRSDPMMLILVAYAFTISVHTVATGALTEATNLSVGVVDEDGSELSRQIAEGLVRPTFQPAVQIRASDIDAKMDRGELLFVVEIPPTFQANVVAQRQTEIQINVDATAVAQAGNGATYLKTAISNEMQHFMNARGIASGSPINLVLRTDFNPNLNTAWFSAMTQVINQITTLTVILTGVALIREREQGTVERASASDASGAGGNHAGQDVRQRASSSSWRRCCRCNSSFTGGSAHRSPARSFSSSSAQPFMRSRLRLSASCSARCRRP